MKLENLTFPATLEGLTFPATPELFTAYQERHIGRKLTAAEKEIEVVWVPIFNDSYKNGKEGDERSLMESVERMDKLIAEHGEEKFFGPFLKSAKWWIIYAWDKGHKEEGKETAKGTEVGQ